MKNLIITFFLFVGITNAQIEVIQYNAGWNASNDVEWCEDLNDCDTDYVDIMEKPKQQEKYNIYIRLGKLTILEMKYCACSVKKCAKFRIMLLNLGFEI